MKNASGVVESVVKQFGAGAAMTMNDPPLEDVRVFPTGCAALDAAIGVGGYPRGRVTEIYGPAAERDVSLARVRLEMALHAIESCQRGGGVAMLVDTDHAFDAPGSSARRRIDLGKLLVSQPDTGEQALDIAEVVARSGAVDLVVVNSVGSMIPRADIEGEHAEPGLQARLMSQALRKLTAIAHRTGTAILFINNQTRPSFSAGGDYSTGGNALKFYASLRIDVRAAGQDERGVRVLLKVAKNKLAPPFQQADMLVAPGGELS